MKVSESRRIIFPVFFPRSFCRKLSEYGLAQKFSGNGCIDLIDLIIFFLFLIRYAIFVQSYTAKVKREGWMDGWREGEKKSLTSCRPVKSARSTPS